MLQISQGRFRLSDTRVLTLNDLTLCGGESRAFVGANGSGKSSLAKALMSKPPVVLNLRRQSNSASSVVWHTPPLFSSSLMVPSQHFFTDVVAALNRFHAV